MKNILILFAFIVLLSFQSKSVKAVNLSEICNQCNFPEWRRDSDFNNKLCAKGAACYIYNAQQKKLQEQQAEKENLDIPVKNYGPAPWKR